MITVYKAAQDNFYKDDIVIDFLGRNIIEANILVKETRYVYETYVHTIKSLYPTYDRGIFKFEVQGWTNAKLTDPERGYFSYLIR